MTHWYRLPSPMSIAKLLFHRRQCFIVDRGLSHDLKRSLPEGTRFLQDIPESEARSCQQVIQLCREKHGVLVTCNEEYTSALRLDVKGAWGIILLPSDMESQIRLWRKMASGNLTFRPTSESTDLVEYAKRNRMLLDIRHDPPVLTLHSECRWTSSASDSR
jgi:hypothetical protein